MTFSLYRDVFGCKPRTIGMLSLWYSANNSGNLLHSLSNWGNIWKSWHFITGPSLPTPAKSGSHQQSPRNAAKRRQTRKILGTLRILVNFHLHSHIHAFSHSGIHKFTHSRIHASMHPCIHAFIQSHIHAFTH